ncbi:possible transcriptional regulator, TetR family protein [Pseudooceanicola batsensis HTCC2597]|uniref:Possible transcriptional regulator, TetR family protein n=1 Tax=Pseudooceanicola batsensis (strain ATCC BAA-863 / DSM 15984 / KCTC 12145 / HTCC2597) TaxID=252305 RepID=A3TT51_PSEBH|nr:TetR/AcrR family transcriptional regulator [Pseudooceanicola batsensis]EAQ04828.1 possible transcriptional regulator, TetR family protein [Pseudooceanicola batsensis HTCC2597]
MPRKPSYDRNELIDRARDLFWRQGWAGTSLKDLEATLQMKPGSFYAAFGSKDALFGLALDRYAQDGGKRLDALAAELGALGALQRYPVLILEDSTAPACACMLAKTLIELHRRDHPLAARADKHLRRMEARFADLFRQAQAAGDIGPGNDPVSLARKYQSDLMGLRVSAERMGSDALEIARQISQGLARL